MQDMRSIDMSQVLSRFAYDKVTACIHFGPTVVASSAGAAAKADGDSSSAEEPEDESGDGEGDDTRGKKGHNAKYVAHDQWKATDLLKFKAFYRHLSKRFAKGMCPGLVLSLDESSPLSRMRTMPAIFRMFFKEKPKKYHVRWVTLVDCNLWIVSFHLHGLDTNPTFSFVFDSDLAMGAAAEALEVSFPIIRRDLFGSSAAEQGECNFVAGKFETRAVVMDRWYSSVQLSLVLRALSVRSVMTVKHSSAHLPEAIHKLVQDGVGTRKRVGAAMRLETLLPFDPQQHTPCECGTLSKCTHRCPCRKAGHYCRHTEDLDDDSGSAATVCCSCVAEVCANEKDCHVSEQTAAHEKKLQRAVDKREKEMAERDERGLQKSQGTKFSSKSFTTAVKKKNVASHGIAGVWHMVDWYFLQDPRMPPLTFEFDRDVDGVAALPAPPTVSVWLDSSAVVAVSTLGFGSPVKALIQRLHKVDDIISDDSDDDKVVLAVEERANMKPGVQVPLRSRSTMDKLQPDRVVVTKGTVSHAKMVKTTADILVFNQTKGFVDAIGKTVNSGVSCNVLFRKWPMKIVAWLLDAVMNNTKCIVKYIIDLRRQWLRNERTNDMCTLAEFVQAVVTGMLAEYPTPRYKARGSAKPAHTPRAFDIAYQKEYIFGSGRRGDARKDDAAIAEDDGGTGVGGLDDGDVADDEDAAVVSALFQLHGNGDGGNDDDIQSHEIHDGNGGIAHSRQPRAAAATRPRGRPRKDKEIAFTVSEYVAKRAWPEHMAANNSTCLMCGKRTYWSCSSCSAMFCFSAKAQSDSCFSQHLRPVHSHDTDHFCY